MDNSSENLLNLVVKKSGVISPQGTTAHIYSGFDSPEGVVIADVGSMYLRTDGGAGTSLYIKESGSGETGWVAK